MVTCADIVPQLLTSDVGRALSSDVMLSACVQAAGVVRAGVEQAKAARDSGHWIALAGLAALGAAVLTVFGVHHNAKQEDRRLRLDRQVSAKQIAYAQVAEIAVAGVMLVPHLADFTRSPSDDQAAFQHLVRQISGAYVVSEPTTLASILDALTTFTAMHSEVFLSRARLELQFEGQVPTAERLALLARSMKGVQDLLPALAGTLSAMRRELGFSADAGELLQVLIEASRIAQGVVAKSIKDVASITPAV